MDGNGEELRAVGKLVAALESRVEIQGVEIERLRAKVHELSNATAPCVMGFPGLLVRLGALELREAASELRIATAESLTPRVERLEATMAAVKAIGEDSHRTITTAGTVIGKFLDRFLLPILLAMLIGWLAIHFGLK